MHRGLLGIVVVASLVVGIAAGVYLTISFDQGKPPPETGSPPGGTATAGGAESSETVTPPVPVAVVTPAGASAAAPAAPEIVVENPGASTPVSAAVPRVVLAAADAATAPTVGVSAVDPATAAGLPAPGDNPPLGQPLRVDLSRVTSLRQPVVVEMPVDLRGRSDDDIGRLAIWYWNGAQWSPLAATTIDRQRGVARTTVRLMAGVMPLHGGSGSGLGTGLTGWGSNVKEWVFALFDDGQEQFAEGEFVVVWNRKAVIGALVGGTLTPQDRAKQIIAHLTKAETFLKGSWGATPALRKDTAGRYVAEQLAWNPDNPGAAAWWDQKTNQLGFPVYIAEATGRACGADGKLTSKGSASRGGKATLDLEAVTHEMTHAHQGTRIDFQNEATLKTWLWLADATAVAHQGSAQTGSLSRGTWFDPMPLTVPLDWTPTECSTEAYHYRAGDFFVYAGMLGPKRDLSFVVDAFTRAHNAGCAPLACLDAALSADRGEGLAAVYGRAIFAMHDYAADAPIKLNVQYPDGGRPTIEQLFGKPGESKNRAEDKASQPPAFSGLGRYQAGILQIRPGDSPTVAVTLPELPQGVRVRGYHLLADDRVDWNTPPHEDWSKPWEVSGFGDQVKGLRLVVANGTANEAAIMPKVEARGEGLIAYAGSDGNIWVIRSDGSDRRRLTQVGPGQSFNSPRWSPDGKQLVFAESLKVGNFGQRPGSIYRIADGKLESVPNVQGCRSPAFSADGTRLFYSCGRNEDGPFYADTPPAQLTSNPAFGAISTSGLDGSDWKVLIPYRREPGEQPQLGSDATVVYIDQSRRDGTLFVVIRGGEGRRLTGTAQPGADRVRLISVPDVGSAQSAILTPRSDGLVGFACRQPCGFLGQLSWNADIVKADLSGKVTETVAALPRDTMVDTLTVSPDGQSVAYTLFGLQAENQQNRTISVARMGSATQPLTQGTDPAWQPAPTPVAAAATTPAPEPRANTSCPLAANLPIVPGPSSDYPFDVKDRSPRRPRGDSSDWVVISCNPDGPGYRVDSSLLHGSASITWSFRAAAQWFEEQGVNTRTTPIEWRGVCRGGPSQDKLVPQNHPDQRCFRA